MTSGKSPIIDAVRLTSSRAALYFVKIAQKQCLKFVHFSDIVFFVATGVYYRQLKKTRRRKRKGDYIMKTITNIALSLETVSGKKLVRLDISINIAGGFCGYGYYQVLGTDKLEAYRIFENGVVEKVEA